MLPPTLDKIVSRFQRITDDKERYKMLIAYGGRLPAMPEPLKTAETKVPGCVSEVYISSEFRDGKMHYLGASEALIARGLVTILVEGLNDLPPEAVLALPPDPLKDTGIVQSLTPSRANGFYNIYGRMRQEALKHLATLPGAE